VHPTGTHFTCFTSTSVQILTQKTLLGPAVGIVEEGDVFYQVATEILTNSSVFDVLFILDGPSQPSTLASRVLSMWCVFVCEKERHCTEIAHVEDTRIHRLTSHSGPRQIPQQVEILRRPFPLRSCLVSFDLQQPALEEACPSDVPISLLLPSLPR
jgi:hypothetical protein